MLSKRSLPLTIILLTIVVGIAATYYFINNNTTDQPKPYQNNNTIVEEDKIDFSTVKTTVADTSNWQIYTDSRLGFKTKIPADWEVKPISPLYEGARDFVMFKRKGDPNETVVADLGFSYYWTHPLKNSIDQELYRNGSNKLDLEYYTFNKDKIAKYVGSFDDPENRWDGDTMFGYTVFRTEQGVRAFAISLFSPQVAPEQTDLITHGILDNLERVEKNGL